MPAPVLRREGWVAGGGVSLRREQIAAPVPPGCAFSIHCIARQLNLHTSAMLRLALSEFIRSRINQLAPVEQHVAGVLVALNDPTFKQGHPRQPASCCWRAG